MVKALEFNCKLYIKNCFIDAGDDMKRLNVNELNFISCEATNTRLMGVVGVHSVWSSSANLLLHVFFHLDYEDYGIDGYTLLGDESQEDVTNESKRMMGGLGGSMVAITLFEMRFLLEEAYAINLEHDELIPAGADAWIDWFSQNSQKNKVLKNFLYKKVCEDIMSKVQMINYTIMRLVGRDRSGFMEVTNNLIDYGNWVNEPSMLLKNASEIILEDSNETTYRVTSLISIGGKYKLYHWIITLYSEVEENKHRFELFELTDQMTITGHEAALLLRRNEYAQVFKVVESTVIKEYLNQNKPELMKNTHENGTLYTAFRTNNNHVKDDNYYLNGDIFAVYYLSNKKELVVSSFDEKCFSESVMEFQGNDFIDKLEKLESYQFNQSLIYEFVHSDFETFNEFVENL